MLSRRELKFRAPPRRKKADEPTIEEMLRPVPKQLVVLEIAPTAQSTASIKEWLEDIELIRGRSSYQGVLSKRIKERVVAIKRVMDILTIRVESKGDVEYLRRRNAELQAQLLASQRDAARMNRRIDELQHMVDELKKYMITDGRIPKLDKATSPLEKVRDVGIESEPQNRAGILYTKEDTVMRPPIKGISTPIPVRGDRSNTKKEDAEITRQIVKLVARRKKLRKGKADTSSERSADPSPVVVGKQSKKTLPQIISNVQIVSPRGEVKSKSKQSTPRYGELSESACKTPCVAEIEEWRTVESKASKKKKVKTAKKAGTQIPGQTNESRKSMINRVANSQPNMTTVVQQEGS